MKVVALYTDVYEGVEYRRTETLDVPAPAGGDVEEWLEEHLSPLCGLGRTGYAGYFIEVLECPDRPDLVGAEYESMG